MFERFTDRARRVVVLAQEEARALSHNYIGTEHILLGLIQEGSGVAARALQTLGISHDEARDEVVKIIGLGANAPTGHIPFTPRAKRILELSYREALRLGHSHIGTEHVLLGLVREGEGVGAQVLRRHAEFERVRQEVTAQVALHEAQEPPPAAAAAAPAIPPVALAAEHSAALARACRDLTKEAAAGELDVALGQEDEIEQLVQALAHPQAKAPMLVCEPGTDPAIVAAGLARLVASGEVPGPLREKRLCDLDLHALAAMLSSDLTAAPEVTGALVAAIREQGDIIFCAGDVPDLLAEHEPGNAASVAQIFGSLLSDDDVQVVVAVRLRDEIECPEEDSRYQQFQCIRMARPATLYGMGKLKMALRSVTL